MFRNSTLNLNTKKYLWSEAEAYRKLIKSRADLEDLQNTGDPVKRWLKRYSAPKPNFA